MFNLIPLFVFRAHGLNCNLAQLTLNGFESIFIVLNIVSYLKVP